MCHRKFNANTLLLMRFLCINVFILLPSRKVYYLFLFTVFVYISIGDYLAYSGELKIPLVPAPEWQFDFELILALMAAINLYIGIYIGPIHIYIGHLIVFWVMWDLLFSFFYEFHSLTTFAPQHIIYFFCLSHFVVAFFSFLCVFLPAFRYFIQFLDAFVQRPHERLFLRKTYKNKRDSNETGT